MAGAPVGETKVYAAAPKLHFGGQADARASELLVSMRMDEAEGGMSRLELRFSDWASLTGGSAELGFAAGSRLEHGVQVEVYVGDQALPRGKIFGGRISALEAEFHASGAPEITVLAEDALQSARMARRSRTYSAKSPKAVVEDVARGLGLVPVVAGLGAPVGTWAQLNESDLAFLRRLLARFDADLQIVAGELHVSPRSAVRRGAPVALDLQDGSLGRARFVADLADQVTAVTVRGWNAVTGKPAFGRAPSGPAAAGSSQRDGPTVLKAAFGERSEHLADVAVATDDEAGAVAQAAFDQRARRFVRVDATAEGNAALRVGAHVRLTGLDRRFDNTYYVVRASHLYDLGQGYRTEFGAECASLGTAS